MRMLDPIPTFSHLISTLLGAHPELAYIHAVDARIDGGHDRTDYIPPNESNDFIRDIIRQKGKGTKLISAGGYTRELGIEVADAKGDLIGYARPFLANVGVYSFTWSRYLLYIYYKITARPPLSLERRHTTQQRQPRDVLFSWKSRWIHRLSVRNWSCKLGVA
jgi:hypothetical protein